MASWSDPFSDLAQWLCGCEPAGADVSSLCLALSLQAPLALVYTLMVPFILVGAQDKDAIAGAAAHRAFLRSAGSGWPWRVQLVGALLLTVALAAALVTAASSAPQAQRGVLMGLACGALAWLLNACTHGKIMLHSTRVIPDYQLLWWLLAGACGGAAAVISALRLVRLGAAVLWPEAVLVVAGAGQVLLFAGPAAYVLLCSGCGSARGSRAPLINAEQAPAHEPLLAGVAPASADAEDGAGGAQEQSEGGGVCEGGRAAAAAPLDSASLCSRLTFSWMSTIMSRGYARPHEQASLPPLPREDLTDAQGERIQRSWRREQQRKERWEAAKASGNTRMICERWRSQPSLGRALLYAAGGDFASAALFKTIFDVLQFSGPLVLHALITYLDDSRACVVQGEESSGCPPAWLGFALVALLLVSSLLQTALLHQVRLLLWGREALSPMKLSTAVACCVD